MADASESTGQRRLVRSWQVDLEALYARPEDVLEISVGDYEIVCHTNLPAYHKTDSRVRRRYNQFVKLRAQLAAENPTVQMPDLSPRRFFSSKFDGATITERVASFQQFLSTVCSHPLVLNGPSASTLVAFLQDPNFSL